MQERPHESKRRSEESKSHMRHVQYYCGYTTERGRESYDNVQGTYVSFMAGAFVRLS